MRFTACSARLLLALVACFLAARAAQLAPASVARAQAEPARELAEKFAPVAYLRVQSTACDRNGEAYFPAPVEVVLGNLEVALKRADSARAATDPVIMMAPTARDLVGLGEEYYLDFPGNPRRAGCTFERGFKRFATELDAHPTAYARIVVDQDAGKLVLQYWLWFYFNDWNNLHEGDWEMIQLVFDTTSVDAALTLAPERVGYAQHGGGETAGWDDPKLAREDGRPVIYPAAGSHATHFEQHHYIGWGENGTGFGCDNATPPGARTTLDVVLIPENPPSDGALAWVHFGGRWGERQEWEFNGPRGPNLTSNWRDPLGGMENWRSSSIYIPASDTLGPSTTGFFCSVVEAGSGVLALFGTEPWLLGALVAAVLGCIVVLFASQRQAIAAAVAVYRRHVRLFLGIGLVAIPIGIIFNGFVFLVRDRPPVGWVVRWFNDTENARLLLALTVGGAQQSAMILIMTPAVLEVLRQLRAGHRPSVLQAFTEGYRKFWPFLVAFIILFAVAGILAIIIIGAPLAIWLGVRWQFFAQAAVLDEAPDGLQAIRRSASTVSGHWWQALWPAVVFETIAFLPGPLIGLVLLLGGKSGVQFANSLSSLIYAITLPIGVIGLTHVYERFRERAGRATRGTGWSTPGAS